MTGALLGAAAFALGLIAMEGVAWAMHRWIMHGPLWSLHRSHHEAGHGGPELNDLFGIVFAGIAVGLFWLGGRPGLAPVWWLGAGVTAYGLLYLLAHDGLVHRRFPLPLRARRGYLRRLVRAHRLHHAARTRDGAVSFGFLYAPDPERLLAKLREKRRDA